MKISLIRLGETKDAHVRALCEDFERRLTGKWQLSHHVLRPCRVSEGAGEKEIAAALEKEADEILALLSEKRRARRIALCVEGREVTSEELAALLEDALQETGEFVFVIGSSHGLSERVKAACDVRLSLSRLTLPHELARLVFSEQLYRAYTILNHMKYHK